MQTISTTRRVLAVVAVTTALCADQAAMSAPATRQEPGEIALMASRLVTRLAQNLRRAMPVILRQSARPALATGTADLLSPAAEPDGPVFAGLSPFQFRLPPPLA